MTASRPARGILFPAHFLRENPDPPSEPERESHGPGGNRWFFGLLGAVLVVSLLGRFLGPIGLIVLWGLVILGFFLSNWPPRRR